MGRGAPGGAGATTAPGPLEVWVARARGAGGLIGFAIVFWACRTGDFTVVDATLRALVGAVALSLVSWWSALLVVQALMRSAAAQAHREVLAATRQAAAEQAAAPGGDES